MTELGRENVIENTQHCACCTLYAAETKFPRNRHPGKIVVVDTDKTVSVCSASRKNRHFSEN
jgi:hypothetical protein